VLFRSTYGHLSAIAVQACDKPGCASLQAGDLIGVSGNSGNSAAPHLHFEVTAPGGRAVDPYGWSGETADPWPYNQGYALWAAYPAVRPYSGGQTLLVPVGGELAYPQVFDGGIIVDDGGTSFSESPPGCWMDVPTDPEQSEGGGLRYTRPVASGLATCSARWEVPAGQPQGSYAVYVHIPALHATSESAIYTVFHAGEHDTAIVNQAAFQGVRPGMDGWIYIGKYEFSGSGDEHVALSNLTQDSLANYRSLELGADAVRYIFLEATQPGVTPSPTSGTP
jgi:hypothetical protein